ncbi:MAG: thiol peroxidase [Porphyromonas endodontalis]|uniref:thiol peroxidase n=1 Tax=Porphyromonas endodontalis TaxID=28124 RepID=UPI003FA042D0
MATTKLKGDLTINLLGEMPQVGVIAPDFTAVKASLAEAKLEEYRGKKVVLNIFPSIDTGVCAASVRRFNKVASEMADTAVLCMSKDLPFAQARFCGAEGLANVETLSAFRGDSFEKGYGLLMTDGPLQGLLARAVVVIDKDGKVVYTELVDDITHEPDYDRAIAALQQA